jgi:hypothetical protein
MLNQLLQALGWKTTRATADNIIAFVEDIKAGKHEKDRLEDGYFNFIGLFRFDQRGDSWVVKGPMDKEDQVVSETWLVSVMAMTDIMTHMGAGMRMAADVATKAKKKDELNSLN